MSAEKIRKFGENAENFSARVESIRAVTPTILIQLKLFHFLSTKKLMEYIDSNNLRSSDEQKTSVNPEAQHIASLRNLISDIEKFNIAKETFPQSALVTLVSHYDAFLGSLVRSMYLEKPELLNSSNRALTFRELTEFGTIEEARDNVIDKEIESILRESHTEQVKAIEKKASVELRKDEDLWMRFVEITERRNLFVHTDGIVSQQYLTVCKEHGCKLAAETVVGTHLTSDVQYFRSACNVIQEMGIKLSQVLWRKLCSDDLEAADKVLNNIAFSSIESENYDLAANLLDFGINVLKKHSSEEWRLSMLLNLAQTYKWKGNQAGCEGTLNLIDWSAKADKYKLGMVVLKDNFVGAKEIMLKIRDKNGVGKENYLHWPIFKKFRESEEFQVAYKEIFGKDFKSEDGIIPKVEKNQTLESIVQKLPPEFWGQVGRFIEDAGKEV